MTWKHSLFNPCLKVMTLAVTLLVVGCSQSPVALLKHSAGELLIIDRVQLKRQRQFVLPSTANIGLFVRPLSAKATSIDYAGSLRSIMIDEGLYTFNRTFSVVTLLDSPEKKRAPSSVEFVVRATLLDAVTLATKEMYIDEGDSDKKKNANVGFISRVRPYHALIKLELLDARSNRSIDVAIIKARSGSLGSLRFNGIVRQSFAAYSKSITAPHSATF